MFILVAFLKYSVLLFHEYNAFIGDGHPSIQGCCWWLVIDIGKLERVAVEQFNHECLHHQLSKVRSQAFSRSKSECEEVISQLYSISKMLAVR